MKTKLTHKRIFILFFSILTFGLFAQCPNSILLSKNADLQSFTTSNPLCKNFAGEITLSENFTDTTSLYNFFESVGTLSLVNSSFKNFHLPLSENVTSFNINSNSVLESVKLFSKNKNEGTNFVIENNAKLVNAEIDAPKIDKFSVNSFNSTLTINFNQASVIYDFHSKGNTIFKGSNNKVTFWFEYFDNKVTQNLDDITNHFYIDETDFVWFSKMEKLYSKDSPIKKLKQILFENIDSLELQGFENKKIEMGFLIFDGCKNISNFKNFRDCKSKLIMTKNLNTLASLEGLPVADTMSFLFIKNNPQLTNLDVLIKIKKFDTSDPSIQIPLTIEDNLSLANCSYNAVCDLFNGSDKKAHISNNKGHCSDADAVEYKCTTASSDLSNSKVKIFASAGKINIENLNQTYPSEISVFTLNGQLLLKKNTSLLSNNFTISTDGFPHFVIIGIRSSQDIQSQLLFIE